MNARSLFRTRNLVYSALCLALCLVLPFLTGQLQSIGNMLCPMHLPVLLCGFLCGWPWGMVVGFVAPLLRSLLFQAPMLYPIAIGMAFELAAYGLLTGLLWRIFRKTIPGLYASLGIAMVGGRLVWGAARFVLAGLSDSTFPLSAFLAGAFTQAIPGIILQIILVPVLVMALKAARLLGDD